MNRTAGFRKCVLTITFLFALLVSILAVDKNQVTFAESDTTVPVYRLYTPVNGEHLYTTDWNEVQVLALRNGWIYEGIGWYAPSTGKPVYRLYNDGLRNHLYTTDTNEVKVLTTRHGWKMDNNSKPLFYSGGQVGIYRLYNEKLNGMHLLTTDANEYKVLPSHGWQQEGTKLAAVKIGSMNYPAGIVNTASQYSIEADVKLTGTGTGYHAKILACTQTSAVSFGIQYDRWGVAPYTNSTTFLIENVANNDAGGQIYTRTGFASLNTTYKLMMTVQKNGQVDVYVNGLKAGSVVNKNLANQQVYLRVEASGRKNGDSVNAVFKNIKLKGSGSYDANKTWGTYIFDTNMNVKSNVQNFAANKGITISGTVTGLTADQDWDSAYDKVSGITQFVE